MVKMETEVLTQEDLGQFTGTERYYSYLMGLKLTDGIKYLADKGKCWWILDAVASYQIKHSKVPFQLWKLEVIENKGKRGAILTMREDSDKPELVKQKIPYTDFPLESIEFYVIDKVVLLPSEY